jgi:hypothetical protein
LHLEIIIISEVSCLLILFLSRFLEKFEMQKQKGKEIPKKTQSKRAVKGSK